MCLEKAGDYAQLIDLQVKTISHHFKSAMCLEKADDYAQLIALQVKKTSHPIG